MRGILVATAMLLLLANTGWAAPTGVEVTLYPSGGRVQVATRMPVHDGKIVFELPAGAQTDSLLLSVEGGDLLRWESVPVAGTEGAGVGNLRNELLKAKQNAASIEGEMTAIQSRISLWKAERLSDVKMLDLEKLDSMMAQRLVPLYVQLVTLEPQYKEALLQVKRLEEALQRKGEIGDGTRITAWLGKNAAKEADAAVVYAYSLSGCGWKPVYRLNAMPDQGLVRFAQEAEIWQGTGQDWKHVRLTLASGALESRLFPQPLREWILHETQPIPIPRGASLRQKMETAPMMATNALDSAMGSDVARDDQATLTTWSLGERDMPAGTAVRLGLESGEWKATFVRLVRPSQPAQQKAAYLQAKVDQPLFTFTSGGAEYFVDGMPVGTGIFPQKESESLLYFGTDPLVTADMKLDRRQSGSKGFVDKRKTQVWAWTIEVSNRHERPVNVQVEDPEPQTSSEDIQISINSNPMPELKDHTRIWNLIIPARGKSTITYSVEASASKDIIDGR